MILDWASPFKPYKSNSKCIFCSFFQDQSACCIRYLQHVQCVIQMRRSVYSPIYYPVKAPWYPVRLPTGRYIYPFPCIALFMITLRCLSYLKKQPKPSIYIHFSKSYIGLHFLQKFQAKIIHISCTAMSL